MPEEFPTLKCAFCDCDADETVGGYHVCSWCLEHEPIILRIVAGLSAVDDNAAMQE